MIVSWLFTTDYLSSEYKVKHILSAITIYMLRGENALNEVFHGRWGSVTVLSSWHKLANFPDLKCDIGESLYTSLDDFVLVFNELFCMDDGQWRKWVLE